MIDGVSVGEPVVQPVVAGDRRRAGSKGDRQRRAILDALPRLLHSRSFSRMSIGDLATAASLSRSGFYFYFDSKEAVLAVAIAEAWNDLDERNMFFRTPRPGDSRFDHLRRSIAATAEVWFEHRALLVAFMQARDTEPVLEQMWAGWMGGLADRLAGFVAEEAAAGRAEPASDDVARLAHVLLDLIAGSLYRAVRAEVSPEAMTREVDVLARLAAAGIWGPVEQARPAHPL